MLENKISCRVIRDGTQINDVKFTARQLAELQNTAAMHTITRCYVINERVHVHIHSQSLIDLAESFTIKCIVSKDEASYLARY